MVSTNAASANEDPEHLKRELVAPLRQEQVLPTVVLTYMVDVIGGDLRSSYKGNSGCVGVFGGCKESCGPPYVAAMSALMAGVDIARIFTTKSTAPAIRTYSADVFVHPVFTEESEFERPLTDEEYENEVRKGVAEVTSWFSRLHCLVVGSGLGRDRLLLDIAEGVIKAAVQKGLSLVLDGDAIFLVARNPSLVIGYHQCVITPNLNEYRRFAHALGVPLNKGERALRLQEVVARLQGPTVLSKGPVDAIANMKYTSICDVQSSAKRCSGQGDVVAGVLGALMPVVSSAQIEVKFATSDAPLAQREVVLPNRPLGDMEMHHITHMACVVTRQSAARTYEAQLRSMLTTDMLPHVGRVLCDLTPAAPQKFKRNASSVGAESESDVAFNMDRASNGSVAIDGMNRARNVK